MIWAILASGPSLVAEDIEAARVCARVVAINSTIFAAPFADVIYASDDYWWRTNIHRLTESAALRVTSSEFTAKKLGLEYHRSHGASNSGLRAIEYAVEQGARDIVLLGYDCGATGGRLHHHADHEPGRNPNASKFEIWRKQFRKMAPIFAEKGARIVNCSRATALDCFPRMGLADGIRHLLRSEAVATMGRTSAVY